jgi:hypothetical protein
MRPLLRRLCLGLTSLILVAVVLVSGTASPVQADSPTLYEYYNTGGDSDSADIYGPNWTAMQFTTGAVAHTITEIVLYLERVGDPGTVTVSIREADGSHFPTGLDIASATLNGNDFSTDYTAQEFTVVEFSLEQNTEYTIVVRAVAGGVADYVLWQTDSGGGLANAEGCHSNNSGVSWATDSPADYLFELWGYSCIRVEGAAAFNKYVDDDELLFVAEVVCIYPPYYPSDDPSKYFVVQLVDTDGVTVLAQTSLREWRNVPVAIYLNADMAVGLTYGSLYYIQIYGTFTGNPSVSYHLTVTDWMGTDLDNLDSWVILTAHSLEDYYQSDLTVNVAGKGEILNEDGGVIFANGIPNLGTVRPDLFQVAVRTYYYEAEEWTLTFNTETTWENQVGTDVEYAFNYFGGWFGVDGKAIGFVLIMVFYMGLALVVVAKGGGAMPALILAYPFIALGAWLRLIDIAIIAIVAAFVSLLLVFSFFWSRT